MSYHNYDKSYENFKSILCNYCVLFVIFLTFYVKNLMDGSFYNAHLYIIYFIDNIKQGTKIGKGRTDASVLEG